MTEELRLDEEAGGRVGITDNWWWSTRFDCCYWCRIRAGTSSKKQVIETKTWNLNWWERDLVWKVCVHCRLLEPSSLPLWKAMQEVVMNGHDDYDDGLLAYSCFAGGVWQCKQIGSWLNKKNDENWMQYWLHVFLLYTI